MNNIKERTFMLYSGYGSGKRWLANNTHTSWQAARAYFGRYFEGSGICTLYDCKTGKEYRCNLK